MIRIARSITYSFPRPLLRFGFCDNAQVKKKSYVMPEQPKLIEPLRVNKKLSFKNGRCLIYLNKQNLSTPYLLDMHYTVPLIYVAYLIATNPFYLTFPAALPMMFMFQAATFLLWIECKAHHKKHIQRVYLLSDGIQVEFVYANKIRRYMKNNEESHVMTIAELFPKYDHQIAEGRVTPYRGVRFPVDTKGTYQQAVKPRPLQYGWTIRDRYFNSYVLPGKFQYADWNILAHVLNGIPVSFDVDKSEGHFLHGNYPKIQQEQQNLKALLKKTDEKPSENQQNQKKDHN